MPDDKLRLKGLGNVFSGSNTQNTVLCFKCVIMTIFFLDPKWDTEFFNYYTHTRYTTSLWNRITKYAGLVQSVSLD